MSFALETPEPDRERHALPAWLVQPPPEPRHGGQTSLLTRFVVGLAGFLEHAFEGERLSGRRGLLQGIDARAKLVGLLALMLVAAFSRDLTALLALLAAGAALVVFSRLDLARFAARLWLVAGAFTLVVTLPAVTSWVTPGEPVVALWGGGSVTGAGLVVVARLVVRVLAAATFGVLLATTTRWDVLMDALRVLRVPRAFVFVLQATYRYTFQLLRLVLELVAARTARTVGPVSGRDDRRFMAAAVGTLFVRSQALGEEVHLAMLARGYAGEVRTLERGGFGAGEAMWLVAVAALIALVIAL